MKITIRDVRNFIQGQSNMIANSISDKALSKEFKEKVKKRQEICLECPLLNKDEMKCDTEKTAEGIKGCGCPFPNLTFAPDKKCPRELW